MVELGPGAPLGNRIETRGLRYRSARPARAHTAPYEKEQRKKREREREREREMQRCPSAVALAHVELVLSGRGSSAKGLERLILLKEYMALLFLPGRIRAAGTAF